MHQSDQNHARILTQLQAVVNKVQQIKHYLCLELEAQLELEVPGVCMCGSACPGTSMISLSGLTDELCSRIVLAEAAQRHVNNKNTRECVVTALRHK